MTPSRFPPDVITAAIASQTTWAIPAALSLAQWALESNYGKAMPKGSNNPFGIKGQPGVATPTHEVVDGRSVATVAWFRHFASLEEAFNAHGKLLATGKPYREAMASLRAGATVADFTRAIARRYATDPRYADKLLSIIHVNDLETFDTPEAPMPAATAKTPAPTSADTSFDLTGMVKEFVQGVVGKLSIVPTIANAAPALVEGAVKEGTDITHAIGDLRAVIQDIEAKKWTSAPHDIEALLKDIFAILSKFGVNLPVLTTMVAALPELPAVI